MAIDRNEKLGLAVYQILREARACEETERREMVRYAFFRPVTIYIGKTPLSGFCREVSETGIGLLHNAELTPSEIEIAIPTEQGFSVHIRTQITWCTRCGEGWYISGGEFIGIARVGAEL